MLYAVALALGLGWGWAGWDAGCGWIALVILAGLLVTKPPVVRGWKKPDGYDAL